MDRRAALRALAATATGGIAGCASLTGDRPTVTPEGAWRQASRDRQNTAFVARELDAGSASTAWETALPDEWVQTQPLVADGRLFVGTVDGSVLAFDAGSGERSWRAETAGVQRAPALLADAVVVPVDDGRLRAFGVDRGSERWSVRLADSPVNAVTVAGERAYASTTDGAVHAVEDGRVAWQQSVGDRTVGKPAVADGTLLVTAERRGDEATGRVVALDAATGEPAWERTTPKPLLGSVAVGPDAVYVPGARQNAMEGAQDTHRGAVFALDPGTGDVHRALNVDPHHAACPVRALAVGPDGLYAVSCARVYAFDAGGSRRWSASISAGVTTGLVACESGVLLGDSNGGVRLLDASTGHSTALHAVPGLAVTPSVVENAVVAAGTHGVALLA